MSEAKYWDGDIPWVSSGEMTQRRIRDTTLRVTADGAREGSKLVPAKTVLAVVRGMSLAKEFRVAITTREVAFNQDLKALIPSTELIPEFLFFYLLSQNHPIRDSASESAHGTKKLDTQVLEEWPIPLPSLALQKAIAAILWAYDDLIEINTQRIMLMEKLAEEVYREWFVRLRFPGHENVKVAQGIPETWDNTRFDKFCTLKRGYDLPDKHVIAGEYPVIASTSITTFHNEFKVKPPVITTGRSGSLGTVLMVHNKAWPLNTALYVSDFFENSPYLIFYTLKNMGLEAFNSGAGVPTLNRNHLNGIKIAVPDKDLQRQFDCIMSPIHEQIEHIRKTNALLTMTHEALLLRLISGKLSVENLDIRFPPDMFEELKAELVSAHA
jgi:type I restriction enzyme, S subunit